MRSYPQVKRRLRRLEEAMRRLTPPEEDDPFHDWLSSTADGRAVLNRLPPLHLHHTERARLLAGDVDAWEAHDRLFELLSEFQSGAVASSDDHQGATAPSGPSRMHGGRA